MNTAWPRVRLGELLRPVERAETVDASREYRLLGTHWYGEGLFIKDIKLGQEVRAARLFRVHRGDFVYNRLFAWKGSFAIAGDDVDGCYVSNEFPCFEPNNERLDTGFLHWWFQRESAWLQALGLSAGATPTSRNRLKEQHFLTMEIPLPLLSEQRRIVARIEELAAQIQEARSLRRQAVEEVENMLVAMAHRLDLSETDKLKAGWKRHRLQECIQFVEDVYRVEADRSYPNFGIYSFARGLFMKPEIDGALTAATTLRRVKRAQFIYSRLFAFEGAYGMVTDEFDGHFVSGEYPTFNCDAGLIRAEFLVAYFKAPSVWKVVAAGSKGLGDRRQRVQPKQLLEHSIWVPPLGLQNQLAEVQAEVDALKRLQTETATELGALLPAILDKAFKGEL